MTITVEDIKKLRQDTGASISDCKEALSVSKGNKDDAKAWLKKKGLDKATSKMDREVSAGLVDVYSHGGRVGVLVELLCETDFVAKTEDFKNLAHELSLQIASMRPDSVSELLEQEYVRDPSQKIDDLIKLTIGKLGENIQIGRFERIELGK